MNQGTPEWFAARLGRCTASRVADVLAKIKTGEAAARRNYRTQLVVERLTGTSTDTYQSPAMQWGIETEPQARMAYEIDQDVLVEEAGFIEHAEIPMFGASPDALIGDDGQLEIKCPMTATHVEWMLAGKVPAEHRPQMLAQLSCTRRQWCDFVSFDPRLPEKMRLFRVRLMRDDEEIAALEAEVRVFLREVDEMVERLRRHVA